MSEDGDRSGEWFADLIAVLPEGFARLPWDLIGEDGEDRLAEHAPDRPLHPAARRRAPGARGPARAGLPGGALVLSRGAKPSGRSADQGRSARAW